MYLDYILDKYETEVKHYRLKKYQDLSFTTVVALAILGSIILLLVGFMISTLVSNDPTTFYTATAIMMTISFVLGLVIDREVKLTSHKFIDSYEEILDEVEALLNRTEFSINSKVKLEYLIGTINMRLERPSNIDVLKRTIFRPFIIIILPVIAFGIGILPDLLAPTELFLVTGVVLMLAVLFYLPLLVFYPLIERRVNRRHILLQRLLEDITDIFQRRYLG
ncbi:conserved membrane protein of unknown function [Petrocella atlantisensis]|uniref:Uncharacterized protein n=1 Tax=Petrocella atlantisensis TaxID=2173034 RepID=A0A3P7S3C0_9FIRM|nr:hypothetical protein [Petrocella atlantisensis]VDN49112.1 conserved membrane protein of unknown function [Petrocella atlantisensis]